MLDSGNILVTGGAGFIGSHICDSLIEQGYKVWCVDDLSLGVKRNIEHLIVNEHFKFCEINLLDHQSIKQLFLANPFHKIFHFAANSDIRSGLINANLDFDLNFKTTKIILELMNEFKVPEIIFSSTSAVFGELDELINENSGPLNPISFYGASKLAAESIISVYASTFNIRAKIFRFPNVVGERATHGIIYDLLNKLSKNPPFLEVLGNGRQAKPYLYVNDLIRAINLVALKNFKNNLNVFNVSGDGLTSVDFIARKILELTNSNIDLSYTGGERGWPGDVVTFKYDTAKIRSLGWSPLMSSDEAIGHSISKILHNGF